MNMCSSVRWLLTGAKKKTKNNRKLKTFSPESARGRLQEVRAYKRLQL